MATRKRAASRTRQSGLVGRAVTAGRKALRQAEKRVPPDVRRQVERSIKDGQKTLKTAIGQLQVQIRKTAKQADVEKALKRIEGLSKQVQQMARNAASGAPARSTRRAASTVKRTKPAARRKPASRKAAARSSASSSAPAAAPKKAPRRAPARRRATPTKPQSPASETGAPSNGGGPST
ncbi:MAG: hypothetical protein PVS2B1_12080 [Candidatus Dormibacteraceae bacterium]